MPGETIAEGDLIKVYIVDVRESEKGGPKAIISRTHPGLVKRLFETEVPEIYDGTVEIKAVSREAGSRTKLAVTSAIRMWMPWAPVSARAARAWATSRSSCSAVKKSILLNRAKTPLSLSRRHWPRRKCSA